MKDVRLFFEKKGELKFISHLDMNRFFIRLLRRTELDVWYTEGFNPHPYITFALPLSLGFESSYEIVDFKLLDETVSLGNVESAFKKVVPSGISIIKASSPKYKAGKIAYAVYELTFENDEQLSDFANFLGGESVIISKKTKRGEVKISNIKDRFQFKATDTITIEMILPCGNENINPANVVKAFEEAIKREVSVSYLRTALLLENGEIFE